jgi:hypothetical protein
MRPWQKLLGMETGGFVLSALCGAVVTAAVLLTVRRILDRRPHGLAALLVATNPLLIYYGSELAFYSLWAAAGAVAFALLTEQCYEGGNGAPPQPRTLAATLRTVALVAAGTAFIAFHFAGLFVWIGVAAAVLAIALRTGGWRLCLRRLPALAVPALLNLPMYIGASRAPEHLGTKTMQLTHMGAMLRDVGTYVVGLVPMLTGGWWFGIALFLVGASALLRGGAPRRRILALSVAMTASVILFLSYSHLRDYMPRVSRYWVYAVAPMLTVLAVGLQRLLTIDTARGANNARFPWRGWSGRAAGWTLGLAVLAGNAIAVGALLQEEGRPHPYARLQRYLGSLPAARHVVSPNFYENRFFGGYYPIPNGGRLLSPCAWEEGRDARVRGLRDIWALAPNAVAYVTDSDRAAEFKDAGVVQLDDGFQHRWPRLLRLAWEWGLYPEPQPARPVAPGLFHETRASLAAAAQTAGKPVVVPEPGWTLVQFRTPQNAMRFALLAGEDASELELVVYVPSSAALDGNHQLELVMASYRATRLGVNVNGRAVPGTSPQLPATRARSQYLPQRQTFEGLPKPEHLLAAGMQFAVELQPATVGIALGDLPAGWSIVRLSAAQRTPWLLLSHACKTPVQPPHTP